MRQTKLTLFLKQFFKVYVLFSSIPGLLSWNVDLSVCDLNKELQLFRTKHTAQFSPQVKGQTQLIDFTGACGPSGSSRRLKQCILGSSFTVSLDRSRKSFLKNTIMLLLGILTRKPGPISACIDPVLMCRQPVWESVRAEGESDTHSQ